MGYREAATQSRREFLKIGFCSLSLLMLGRQAFGGSGDVTSFSLQQVSNLIRNKSISPVELTKACLERIQRLDPRLNAFITVTAEQALAQARGLENERQRGRLRGPLHGIPLAIKDNIDTAGIRTTAGSAVFAGRVPSEDAEVVRRLKAAGAIIIGKLNLDEFAFGLTSTLSHFHPVHNPWKLDYIAGGSSGGSAVAVSANLCYGALGSDTGGSMRVPAAYCGVVALKPTYGLVSTNGLIPLSWSLDHVGPMCRSVTDTALLLSAIAGHDSQDSASVNAPAINYVAACGIKTSALRLGLSRQMFSEIADPEIKEAVNESVSVLRSMTASVRDIELPPIPQDTWVNVALPEAHVFHAPLLAAAAASYNPVVRRRAEQGSTLSAKNYIEARRHIDGLRRTIGNLFSDVDLIVAPSAYVSPITIEQSIREEAELAKPPSTPAPAFNIYGIPTISVPCGFTSAGFPIGLQIAGPRLGETKVIALACAYERATDWHNRRPAL